MHVLIATDRTQGDRPDDYHHAVTGELVRLPGVECADPGCGCQRGFAGMASSRATTTAEVVDRADLSPLALWSALVDDLTRSVPDEAVQIEDIVLLLADWLELARLAGSLPTGTVIGRRHDQVTIRAHGPLPAERG